MQISRKGSSDARIHPSCPDRRNGASRHGSRAPIAVAQLQQLLSAQRAANRKDSEIAAQINTIQLTEQLTSATLDSMVKELNPGPKTTLALDLLSDVSLFLDPPANELPSQPAPDATVQQSMVSALIAFAADTLGHLPNFIATRTTRSFDNTPQVTSPDGYFQPLTDLHLARTYSQEVTYRDGQEVTNSDASASGKDSLPLHGVTSTGEFGPLLELVLADIDKGKVRWSPWEQTPAGRAAVFAFEVQQEASHFQLNIANQGGGMGPSAIATYEKPAYHGDISINPDTGEAVRLRLQSDLASRDPVKRADMLVDYAPVQIGDKTYMCPVRSVTIFSREDRAGARTMAKVFLWLNEVSFTNYHRFGSTMQILTTTPQQ